MPNVYDKMKLFYASRPKAMQSFLPRETVERFLRQGAWQGVGDDELKRQWKVLELLLTVADEWKTDALEFIPAGDYREMYRRFIQGRRLGTEKQIRELEYFFQVLLRFFEFYGKEDADFYRERLRDAKNSFFAEGQFILPKPQEKEDFYSVLDHKEMLFPEDMEKLNEILDGILAKLGEYFHKGKFIMDFTRAMAMYGGKDFDPGRDIKEADQEDFYFGFWDYFLFDYHLIETDTTPLAHYYQCEHKKLSFTESSIIRDLLKARFTIFSIEGMREDAVICRDLFTDEQMELPLPEVETADYHRTIFLGHVHNSGVMLLNYITSIPASPKLRGRIKREVLRQYELFRYQEPEAELSDFFRREAAAVRQTVFILTEYAQLNVLPFQQYAEPVPREKDKLPRGFDDAVDDLETLGHGSGMSLHAVYLLRGLYTDYCLLTEDAPDVQQSPDAVVAVLYVFYLVNGLKEESAKRSISAFQRPWNKVRNLAASIYEKLRCKPYDPRYLTEEGFIQMLYTENP